MDRDGWDARYAASELVWSAEPNRFLVDEVSSLGAAPGRALDLACGEGRNAIWLASLGWRVVGVDFSAVAVEKARRLAAARPLPGTVEWVVDDVTSYTPPASAFDLVAVLYLHLPEPSRSDVWRRAWSAVAPGGHLLVIGHDRTNLTDGYGGPQDASVLYGPDDVVAAVGDGAVERAERVRRPVETDGGTVDAIDVLVRVERVPASP
jgi:SAM-dependent methyltransferase